ncbi:hypothetical protein OC846_001940 [Tilletia horrida]|uniref:Ribonuclease H1 N-terminal domain-containing protein n=1 Tax=Tilletia horrida TaxID=155126 RepID=A0AAN6JSL2_9BASI|nr:hypothetical protein OC846_001940 [Tilletia horrida]
MAAPISINQPTYHNGRDTAPQSVSLKDRVVRSFSLRRNKKPEKPSISIARAGQNTDSPNPSPYSLSSSVPSPVERYFRRSVDSRRPTSSSSGNARNLALGSSFGTAASPLKPPSPLGATSYTENPFDSVNISPSAHDLTGTHRTATTASSGKTLVVPTSPSFSALRKRGPAHAHSQSHSNITSLARSLSRSKYLGGSGSSPKDADRKKEISQLADDSYVVVSPKNTPARTRTKSHARASSRPEKDLETLVSQRPLLRSRSFDSLVPSLLSDVAPLPRLIQSTKRAEPLRPFSPPPTKNVFSMQRIPWADEDAKEDDSVEDPDEDSEIPPSVPPKQPTPKEDITDVRASRERAQSADARLCVVKTKAAEMSKVRTLDVLEELSTPIEPPNAGTFADTSFSAPPTQQHLSSSQSTTPQTSPSLYAVRMKGLPNSPTGNTAGSINSLALRDFWTKELEGKTGPFIVVERGWKRGIYTNGDEAAKQVRDFPGPRVRKVETAAEAVEIIAAHQPVMPSPTTAEGLLARSGSVRNNQMTSPYGAAGARAIKSLGLSQPTDQEASGAEKAVPVHRGEVSRSRTAAHPGATYAARRAARLKAEAEAAASVPVEGEPGSLKLKSDGSKAAGLEHGKSTMESCRVLYNHDTNQGQSGSAIQSSPRRERDRTRSGAEPPTSFSASPSYSSKHHHTNSISHRNRDRDQYRDRPSSATARSRQFKAAELEYGLNEMVSPSSPPRSGAHRHHHHEREGSSSSSSKKTPGFGYAYASELGAAVTVQRAHTVSGAR